MSQGIDATMKPLEEIRFKMMTKPLILRLSKELPLKYDEIVHLALIYYKVQKITTGLKSPVQRTVIMDVIHNCFDLTDCSRVNYSLLVLDKNPNIYMTLENWIRMMSLFLKGSLEEKIKFCFETYNVQSSNPKILRSTMWLLMQDFLLKDNNEPDDDSIKDMIDMTVKKLDVDRDGKISFDDYRKTVLQTPGLLEIFGQLLPSRLAIYAFKSTCFSRNFRK